MRDIKKEYKRSMEKLDQWKKSQQSRDFPVSNEETAKSNQPQRRMLEPTAIQPRLSSVSSPAGLLPPTKQPSLQGSNESLKLTADNRGSVAGVRDSVGAPEPMPIVKVPKPEEMGLRPHEKKLLIEAISITGLFCFAWTPYMVMMIIEMVSGAPVSPGFDQFATLWVSWSTTVNPYLLIFVDDYVKTCVFELFGLRKRPPVTIKVTG